MLLVVLEKLVLGPMLVKEEPCEESSKKQKQITKTTWNGSLFPLWYSV